MGRKKEGERREERGERKRGRGEKGRREGGSKKGGKEEKRGKRREKKLEVSEQKISPTTSSDASQRRQQGGIWGCFLPLPFPAVWAESCGGGRWIVGQTGSTGSTGSSAGSAAAIGVLPPLVFPGKGGEDKSKREK